MTNKRTSNSRNKNNSRFLRCAAEGQTKGQAAVEAKTTADSSAALRNDKQKDKQQQKQKQQQILPLRCGMTNKRTSSGRSKKQQVLRLALRASLRMTTQNDRDLTGRWVFVRRRTSKPI
jgi:hypothetical protein